MTIRERTERREQETLSPQACLSSQSRGRERPIAPCGIRTEFQRDIDRIVHCKAFRRLKHKTQVFLQPEGDHYRTRMTHTLEVSRIARTIARALSLDPRFIVCDEPVSALDVSIQAQILNLMQDLQERLGLTYIFITHDLSVVKHISDDIMVMYLGQVVEKCSSDALFANPRHPYTRALLSAIPIPSLHVQRERVLLKGELSSPVNPKPGCRFAPRCAYATSECFQGSPPPAEDKTGHFVACHHSQDV